MLDSGVAVQRKTEMHLSPISSTAVPAGGRKVDKTRIINFILHSHPSLFHHKKAFTTTGILSILL